MCTGSLPCSSALGIDSAGCPWASLASGFPGTLEKRLRVKSEVCPPCRVVMDRLQHNSASSSWLNPHLSSKKLIPLPRMKSHKLAVSLLFPPLSSLFSFETGSCYVASLKLTVSFPQLHPFQMLRLRFCASLVSSPPNLDLWMLKWPLSGAWSPPLPLQRLTFL